MLFRISVNDSVLALMDEYEKPNPKLPISVSNDLIKLIESFLISKSFIELPSKVDEPMSKPLEVFYRLSCI